MAAEIYFVCFLAFIQAIKCQCIGNPLNNGLNNLPIGSNFGHGLGPGIGGLSIGTPGFIGPHLGPSLLGNGLFSGYGGPGIGGPAFGGPGLGGPGSQNSGSFVVTSSSPIGPTGISILAENLAIEGPLTVGGQLPFLGSVGVEGNLPATGSGTVSYGCGNGNVGISNEANLYGPHGPGLAGYGDLSNLNPALGGINPGLSGINPGLGGAIGVAHGPGLNVLPGINPSLGGLNPGLGGLNPGLGGLNPGFNGHHFGLGNLNSGLGGVNPSLSGLNPGIGGAFGAGLSGPGLLGPGFNGNGLGGVGVNLAGSGIAPNLK